MWCDQQLLDTAASRFEAERREAEERKAKAEVDAMPAGEKKRAKRQYPEAVDYTTRLKDLTAERERKKRHDRRGERYALSPHVSPEPASTAAKAAGTPAPATTPAVTCATPSVTVSTPPTTAFTPANMDHWIATASPQAIAAFRAKLDQPTAAAASASSQRSHASHTSSAKKRRNERAASDVTGGSSK